MGKDRRSVLRAAASGIGALSVSGIASAEESERKIVTITKQGRKKPFGKLLKRTTDASKLIQYLERNGWQPKYTEGKYANVITEGDETYKVASVGFENVDETEQEDSNSQLVLTWDSRSDTETTAHEISSDGRETTYRVSDGEVRSEEFDEVELSGGEFNDGNGGGSVTCNHWKDTYCAEWDLSCIGLLVAALGLSCTMGLLGCFLGATVETGACTYSATVASPATGTRDSMSTSVTHRSKTFQ